MSHTIQSGPFAGTVIPQQHLSTTPEGRTFWPTRARTPLFLGVYQPDKWTVKCTATPRTEMGKGMVEFRAFLVDSQNIERNSASTLAIIVCQSDWDMGETIARGRLYDALGLALVEQNGEESDLTGEQPVKTTASAIATDRSSAPATQAAPIALETETATQSALPLSAATPPSCDQPTSESVDVGVMGNVNPQLLRVLTARCEALGKAVPTCRTDEEVRTEIRNVFALRGAA